MAISHASGHWEAREAWDGVPGITSWQRNNASTATREGLLVAQDADMIRWPGDADQRQGRAAAVTDALQER